MDFEYKGANCVVISSKLVTLVVDGKLSSVGLKDVIVKDEVEVATQAGFATRQCRLSVDMPGEYEINDVSLSGIPAARLIDFDGSLQSTMYKIIFPEATVAVIGHVATPLSDEQLESLGVVDVLIVPVGGGGYTLDAHHAVELVHKIDPKVVIPTHYADKVIKYEVPQEGLEPFLKELGAAHEVSAKWKVKNGVLPTTLTVMELTRSS